MFSVWLLMVDLSCWLSNQLRCSYVNPLSHPLGFETFSFCISTQLDSPVIYREEEEEE